VRQRQPLGRVHELAEQQQVDVDRTRPMPHPPRLAPELAFDRLAGVEQLLGIERRLDAQAGVQEVALI
jgi:hypothetical protein